MTKDVIKYLVFSDVHLGNPRNDALDIISNIKEMLKSYDRKNKLDIIFIAGDLFDRLITLPSDTATESLLFMAWLLNFCARNQTKLRVLEGTPSHDWLQCKQFETTISVSQLPIDFKYITTVHVEHMEDLDIHVLYVPDEWDPSTDKTYEDVLSELKARHVSKVDIAIMHGQFGYQLPAHIQKIPRHNEENYLNIVKYFISIGHIHTSSVFSRILAQGSVDRLSHNEEEAKGMMECHIYRDGQMEYFFIENKNAKVFKTIDISELDSNKAMKKIDKLVSTLPFGSYVRLKALSDHPTLNHFDEVKKKYPSVIWSKKVLDQKETNINDDDLIRTFEQDYAPILLTRNNLHDLLMTRIKSDPNHIDALTLRYEGILNDVL